MTYTAYNALSELDKFPVFKRELAEALDAAARYAKWGISAAEEINLIGRMLKLGSMVSGRAEWDAALANREILRKAFHNDPKVTP